MARCVAERLDRGARDDALRLRLVRFFLMEGRLRELGRLGRADAGQLAALFRTIWKVDGRRLISLATSFFWRNLHRCAAQGISGDLDLHAVVACQAFDAFFEILPDQTAITLSGTGPFRALFPRLGLILPNTKGPITFRRTSSSSLDVDAPELRISINLHRVNPALRLPCFGVPGHAPAEVLAVREQSLYEDPFAPIDPDPRLAAALASAIGDALNLVRAADPELGDRVRAGVRWYVPLRPFSETTDRAFTVSLLSDVIFLSTTHQHQLAENIVHELMHSELNLLQEVEPLFDADAEQRYYSPWRDDPRPLHGLVHALHVFSGVADFLVGLENVAPTAETAEWLRARRLTVVRQLRVALKQVPREKFTPAGKELLEDVDETVESHERLLGVPAGRWPGALLAHISAWVRANPDLACALRLPQSSF
jgi:HEXXH motif-containing protein